MLRGDGGGGGGNLIIIQMSRTDYEPREMGLRERERERERERKRDRIWQENRPLLGPQESWSTTYMPFFKIPGKVTAGRKRQSNGIGGLSPVLAVFKAKSQSTEVTQYHFMNLRKYCTKVDAYLGIKYRMLT